MLRYIYMFFAAVFLAMFVGIGIAVFYPEPKAPTALPFMGDQLTEVEKQQQREFNAADKAYQAELWTYNRNVSLIAMTCAVLVLVVALVFAAQLGVLADGLLLGGIFTLLYGIGRGMLTDSNQFRFLAAAIGLAVTFGLGYIKFTRPGVVSAPAAAGKR